MKPGPIIAMIALIFVGVWLVLQPTLRRAESDHAVTVGALELLVEDTGAGLRFVEPPELAALGELTDAEYVAEVRRQTALWNSRPALERTLLGFFNITSWFNFGWVALGLGGQACFFGRMFVQWVKSEKERSSVVPPVFWWLSFFGGALLFTYFVWRVDFVGVLGQSSGVVIYARNIRLIHKEKRRAARREAEQRAEPSA
ncbi:MAG: lipid-A-disaccharide synthase N-terminal domain-containing protein [Phycisphaerales bacterium]|nr:lipid-A-disaccharide synthase N-terminal domain-containing protein [Phycisphaerales bacterium]